MENYASKPIMFILLTLVSFIQFVFILRFLFEIMRVNFYNPVSQIIVRITDPILKPMRVIPLYIGRVDIIIILIATSITALKIYIPYSFSSFEFSLNTLVLISFGKFLDEALTILWWSVIIGAVGSWFMSYTKHPLFSLIDELCEPLYIPIRRILPATAGIDFSPIILLVFINLTQMILIPPIFHLARIL